MKHIEDLKTVIWKLHGAEPTHRESVPVKETWNGQTIWEGSWKCLIPTDILRLILFTPGRTIQTILIDLNGM